MGRDELSDKVRGWVETSGRALELRTARALQSAGEPLHVNQSVTYEDVTTRASREGDVLAVYRWAQGLEVTALNVTVECKSGAAHPWVAFFEGRTFVPEDASAWFLRDGDNKDTRAAANGAAVLEAWKEQPALFSDRVPTHTASALGKDGVNLVHDAARQALSFARSQASRVYGYVGDPPGIMPAVISVPVVITAAPMFACELSADGEVQAERVQRFDVMVSAGGVRRRVYVRNEASLPDLANAFTAVQTWFGAHRN